MGINNKMKQTLQFTRCDAAYHFKICNYQSIKKEFFLKNPSPEKINPKCVHTVYELCITKDREIIHSDLYVDVRNQSLIILTRKSYSVTQSSSNSLLGDVVLDGFNMGYRNEDSLLDQTYQKQVCLDF